MIKCIDGEYIEMSEEEVAAYHAQLQADNDAIAAPTARNQRDLYLRESDWTQVADAPVDKAAWAAYRQLLRDIPQQTKFPDDIVWPLKP